MQGASSDMRPGLGRLWFWCSTILPSYVSNSVKFPKQNWADGTPIITVKPTLHLVSDQMGHPVLKFQRIEKCICFNNPINFLMYPKTEMTFYSRSRRVSSPPRTPRKWVARQNCRPPRGKRDRLSLITHVRCKGIEVELADLEWQNL